MKRLLFLLCLFSASLTGTYANTVYDVVKNLSGSTTSWGITSATTSNDTVSIQFSESWGTYGWVDWYTDDGGLIDLTPYDYVMLTYEVTGSNTATFTIDSETPTGEYVTSKEWSDEASDSVEVENQVYTSKYVSYDLPIGSGTIKCSVAELADTLDLPYLSHFYITTNSSGGSWTSCTVKISSLKLVKVLPIISGAKTDSNDMLNLAWEETQDWADDGDSNNDSGSITVGEYNDDFSAQSATLTFKNPGGKGMDGLGWSYYNGGGTDLLDLSGYSRIVVHYTVDTTSSGDSGQGEGGQQGGEGNQGGPGGSGSEGGGGDQGGGTATTALEGDVTPTIDLYVQDWNTSTNSGNSTGNITGTITDGEGTITCDLTDSSYSGVNFAKIGQITIEADTACVVNITSIELIATTISTSSSDFITTTSGSGSTEYLLNLNVTKTGSWTGGSSNSQSTDPVTSANITFKYANQLSGFEYTDSINSTTHLNLESYTPAGGESITFTDMEVRYTISSSAERSDENRLRVMLELMDGDGSYKNIEAYDTYSIGRIRVKFSDYNTSGANSDINFSNIQTLTFLLENIPSGENPVLNIESIQLFTEGSIPELGSEADTLLISQLYVTDTASKVTPLNTEGSVDTKATVASAAEWTLATWYFDDVNMDNYWGAEVNVTTSSSCAVRLEIVYKNTIPSINNNCECISFHCDGTETTQTLLLPFIKNEYISNVATARADGDSNQADISSDVTQIYLIWGRVNAADSTALNLANDSIKFTINSARLLQKTAYSDNYLTITVNTDEGYCTYYNEKQAYKMPYGMQGTRITNIGDKDNTLSTDTEEYYTLTTDWTEYPKNENNLTGGTTVPAGTPLLLQGSEDQNVILSYTAFYADNSSSSEGDSGNAKRLADEQSGTGGEDSGSESATNLLHGSDTQTTPASMKSITHTDLGDNTSVSAVSEDEDSSSNNDTDATDEDYYYYLFTYKTGTWDSSSESYGWPYTSLGFYWSSVYKGGPFCSNAHRAWLALPKNEVDSLGVDATSEGKTIGFVIGDNSNIDDNSAADNETTGIAAIATAAPADGAIYTLQGIRVNSMSRPGIYIVGGRKVVKK